MIEIDIDGVGRVSIDDSFLDLPEEERQTVLKEIVNNYKSAQQFIDDGQQLASQVKDYKDVGVEMLNETVSGAPGALGGALGGAALTPFFPPLGGTIGGIAGYFGSNALLDDYTGKVINRENFDKLENEGRSAVLSLGDDFGQGVTQASPSEITDYNDSSSTGLLRPRLPQI
jgi:hypothetical protein